MSFVPYVSPEESQKEFTVKAVLAGIFFGVLFGAANAYLGLRVGLTISTSIPVAVVTVALFRGLRGVLGPATILEHNTSQTIGSASSSLASGMIFTIPALFLWGLHPSMLQIATLVGLGGLLGVLYMIPLRQFLIVQEHAKLPYPEGKACAEVLVAADKGGSNAKPVFIGIGVGLLFKFVLSYLKLWPAAIKAKLMVIPKALVSLEATPALLGVGYILGFRISLVMVLGSAIAWVIIIPMLAAFGDTAPHWLIPNFGLDFATADEYKIWHHYVRYIGAGAVTFGGLITVIQAIPKMMEALKKGVSVLFGGEADVQVASPIRTDDNLNFKYLVIGVAFAILVIMFSPHVLGTGAPFGVRFFSALFIALFAFLFVTVSSRIVGFVGVSSNPTSGMTIVTLLTISTIFLMLGMTDISAQATALTIGTVVCTAASIAGDCSQDLKTGYLLGATPKRQQIGEIIGVMTSAFFVAGAVVLLGKAFTFGSTEIPAPQATLMKTVIEAVLSDNLPWGLILIGAGLAAIAEFVFRVPSLAFAVGVYIPLATFTSIFVGGCLRHFVDKRAGKKESLSERDTDPGILLSSGFIAGEGLMGVVIAAIAFITKQKSKGVSFGFTGIPGEIVSLLAFAALGYLLYRVALAKEKA